MKKLDFLALLIVILSACNKEMRVKTTVPSNLSSFPFGVGICAVKENPNKNSRIVAPIIIPNKNTTTAETPTILYVCSTGGMYNGGWWGDLAIPFHQKNYEQTAVKSLMAMLIVTILSYLILIFYRRIIRH